MPLDDVFRQAQAIGQQAGQAQRAADEQRRARVAAATDFDTTLHELGRWFATEARNRGLATVPFYSDGPEWQYAQYSKSFLGFGGRRIVKPAGHVHPSPTGRGWALYPLTEHGVQRYAKRKMGGHLSWGELADYFLTAPCLAVDTSGDIREGVASDEAVYVIGPKQELTRDRLLIHSGLGSSAPLRAPFGLDVLDTTYHDRMSVWADGQHGTAARILPYYAAYANDLLGTSTTTAPVQWHIQSPKPLG